MDKYDATAHISPFITSTRELHEWLSRLAREGMSAVEMADTIGEIMNDAVDNMDVYRCGMGEHGISDRTEGELMRGLALVGLASVDWRTIAAEFVERETERRRHYFASADETIGWEEMMEAARSVFGHDEVEDVFYEHGQWWVRITSGMWSVVDASPGTTSVTHPETGAVYRLDFEMV